MLSSALCQLLAQQFAPNIVNSELTYHSVFRFLLSPSPYTPCINFVRSLSLLIHSPIAVCNFHRKFLYILHLELPEMVFNGKYNLEEQTSGPGISRTSSFHCSFFFLPKSYDICRY